MMGDQTDFCCLKNCYRASAGEILGFTESVNVVHGLKMGKLTESAPAFTRRTSVTETQNCNKMEIILSKMHRSCT